jgi:hypothetical protein
MVRGDVFLLESYIAIDQSLGNTLCLRRVETKRLELEFLRHQTVRGGQGCGFTEESRLDRHHLTLSIGAPWRKNADDMTSFQWQSLRGMLSMLGLHYLECFSKVVGGEQTT